MVLGGLVERGKTEHLLILAHGSYFEYNVWVCKYELRTITLEQHQSNAEGLDQVGLKRIWEKHPQLSKSPVIINTDTGTRTKI